MLPSQFNTGIAMNISRIFKSFCESTSLHGYSYLFIATSVVGKVFFALVIVSLTCIGAVFLALNCANYSKSTLVTTIETNTAPLSEATFPSITVCNFNQLEASYLRDIGIHGKQELKELLVKRYVKGHEKPFTEREETLFAPVQDVLDDQEYDPFFEGRQWCRNLFIHSQFENLSLPWSSMKEFEEHEIGAWFYGTDSGSCCFLSPHNDLVYDSPDLGFSSESAKHGKSKGLKILLDIEQFNYGHVLGQSAGLKLALHHYLDKPMMQFSSHDITIGSETQINIKPVVTVTTNEAIEILSPDKRNCYVDSEVNLTILRYEDGYRYEMNNCLIDEGILEIYWQCRCAPLLVLIDDNDPYFDLLSYCYGQNLHCANEIMKIMGNLFEDQDNITEHLKVQEAIDNPHKIGNITRPAKKSCLPRCDMQEYNTAMSFAQYPPDEGFFEQHYFCYVASHILQVTCTSKSRKYFLEKKHPNLCKVLTDFEQFFGNESDCVNWPKPFFKIFDEENQTLTEEMQKYGKRNLALVNVFFQSPYMTKMKRDLEMTLTDFIASTGGLLGLYLGFSFVSLFEIFFWCFNCCSCKKRSIADLRG